MLFLLMIIKLKLEFQQDACIMKPMKRLYMTTNDFAEFCFAKTSRGNILHSLVMKAAYSLAKIWKVDKQSWSPKQNPGEVFVQNKHKKSRVKGYKVLRKPYTFQNLFRMLFKELFGSEENVGFEICWCKVLSNGKRRAKTKAYDGPLPFYYGRELGRVQSDLSKLPPWLTPAQAAQPRGPWPPYIP